MYNCAYGEKIYGFVYHFSDDTENQYVWYTLIYMFEFGFGVLCNLYAWCD